MILIIELFLLVLGIRGLFWKRWPVGKGKEIVGGHARVLGLIACTPLPLTFGLGFAIGILLGLTGGETFAMIVGLLVELGVLVAVGLTLVVLGSRFYAQQVQVRLQQAALAAKEKRLAEEAPGADESE